MSHLQALPTAMAKPRMGMVFGFSATWTRLSLAGREIRAAQQICLDEMRTEDARGHGDDAVADQDHDRGDELAQWSLRGDVAKADRGHGDDSPVHRVGNAGESVFGTFDEVHDGAEYDRDKQNEQHEHADLSAARVQGAHQLGTFVRVIDHLENAEHSKDTQYADHQQMISTHDEQADVGRQSGQQINKAIETQRVVLWSTDQAQAYQVFQREGDRENPFKRIEDFAVMRMQQGDAVKQCHEHADEDDDEQDDVKASLVWLVMAEDHAEPVATPTLGCRGPETRLHPVFSRLAYTTSSAQSTERSIWGGARIAAEDLVSEAVRRRLLIA